MAGLSLMAEDWSMRLFNSPHRIYKKLEDEYTGRKILDVGVGRRKFKGSVGLDVRENSFADIKHDLSSFPWPVESDSYDLIVIRHVMEHLQHTHKVMEELYRACKPGGKVIIEVPHFSNVEAFRHWQHVHFFTAGSFDYFHEKNINYKAYFMIKKRWLFFDDISKILLIECLANLFIRTYERHFAFILPAGSLYLELEAIK